MACSLINNGDEQFYESIDLIPIVIDVTDFETIIQKYVGYLKTIMILWILIIRLIVFFLRVYLKRFSAFLKNWDERNLSVS